MGKPQNTVGTSTFEKIKKDIFGHSLYINSDYYTEMDKDNIPTGKKISVNNIANKDGIQTMLISDPPSNQNNTQKPSKN